MTCFWRHDVSLKLWRVFDCITNYLTSWRISVFDVMNTFLTLWPVFEVITNVIKTCHDTKQLFMASKPNHEKIRSLFSKKWLQKVRHFIKNTACQKIHRHQKSTCSWRHDERFDVMTCIWLDDELFNTMTSFWRDD